MPPAQEERHIEPAPAPPPAGLAGLVERLCGPAGPGGPGALWPRWIFLRCLGLIFFSAFYSLAFQIEGLLGPRGLLPAGDYPAAVARIVPGPARFYYAPTFLWAGAGDTALAALAWGGMIVSLSIVFNLWPRVSIAAALVLFLSFVAAAQDFSGYQSDGMLLEAAL